MRHSLARDFSDFSGAVCPRDRLGCDAFPLECSAP
jgi:hypothetical protein